jgi:IclR family KDG regulon transcriptional repressor
MEDERVSNAREDYIVQPVMKALHVLEYVAGQAHDVTLTEVVKELKLPKTTVFRYLQTLSATSFLQHDRHRDRYGVGPRLRSLSKLDKSLHRLRHIARPEMTALMQRFGETVNLAVLSDSHIVYIEMVEPDRALRMHARIGDRHPVHSTSLGKAIVAFLPDPSAYLAPGQDLEARTFRTLTDVRALRRQIEEVRRNGHAVEIGENEDGLMCIGAPIFDGLGLPLAAMSLSAPERRMPRQATQEAVEALKAATRRISQQFREVGEDPADGREAAKA